MKKQLQGRHLHIHLIAHTHDDVGWIKTVDEFFSGTDSHSISKSSVRIILDTVIDELVKDPTRKFTYVEMKFF